MKRRDFLGAAAGSAALSAAGVLDPPKPSSASGIRGERLSALDPRAGLAGKALEELRNEYHSFLFEDFLPFMEKYVIDREYGGFMCGADRDGSRLNTFKTPTNEGRGMWVWSYLYSELDRSQKHLDAAKKSLDLVLKSRPEGDALWARSMTREGEPAAEPDTTIYGDLYIAAGIAEYARAARDPESWKLAKSIMKKCIRIYDRPDYDSISGDNPVAGPRRQNVSMLLLPAAASLLGYRSDSDVEAVAARCVDAVVSRHFNPDCRLNNDILNHDYSRPENGQSQYASFGIAVQTLWMVLHEGLRRKDRALYDTAAERLLRHVEVAWDDVYGGLFSELIHIDANTWNMKKPLHVQVEALVGLLSIIEHSGDARARDLFSRLYAFTVDNYVLKKRGFPLWQSEGERRVTFQPHSQRAEHFHNSRHLMMNLGALNRIIARKGKTSGLLPAGS